jgi:hypothetical protein
MQQRIQTIASGAILVLIIGWVLHLGTAVFFHIEFEPTWTTLRQDLLAQIDVQGFIR